MPLDVKRAIGPLDSLATQQWQQTDSVELHVVWLRHPAEFKQGRDQVNVRGDSVNRPPGFQPARPANKERHSDAALVDTPFAFEHSAVETRLLRAVVGQEKDQGVFGQL